MILFALSVLQSYQDPIEEVKFFVHFKNRTLDRLSFSLHDWTISSNVILQSLTLDFDRFSEPTVLLTGDLHANLSGSDVEFLAKATYSNHSVTNIPFL